MTKRPAIGALRRLLTGPLSPAERTLVVNSIRRQQAQNSKHAIELVRIAHAHFKAAEGSFQPDGAILIAMAHELSPETFAEEST